MSHCEHRAADGITCTYPPKLNTRCFGTCKDQLDNLDDLYLEDKKEKQHALGNAD